MLFTKKTWLKLGLITLASFSAIAMISCANKKATPNVNSTVVFIEDSENITFEKAVQNLQIVANSQFGEEFNGKAVTVANIIPNSEIAVVKGRQVYERKSGNFPIIPFYFDVSAFTFTGTNSWLNLYSAQLLRSAALGQSLLDVKVINNNGVIKNEISVRQPSLTFYKLELIKTIEITFENGTIKIYNNDKHELLPEFPDRKFHETSYQLSSLDPHSINNPLFFEDLKNAKKISLSVKDNLHWVNHQGQKTKYLLKAEDFFFSYWRTKLADSNFRHQQGGSKDLDDILFAETAFNRFGANAKVSTPYIYDLYGLDQELLLDREASISKNSFNEEAFTLHALKDVKNRRLDLAFKLLLFNNNTFLPVPSQYIKDNNQKFNEIKGKRFTNDTQTIKRKVQGWAAETGIYWYGKNLDTILFASPFIPHKIFIQGSEGTITFKANPHYADQVWVNSKTRILDITRQYQKEVDLNATKTRLYNSFATGILTTLELSRISESKRQGIISGTDQKLNPARKYLNYSISKNIDNSHNDWMWLVHPKSSSVSETTKASKKVFNKIEPKYKWNDNYAKIVYGTTIAKLKEGKAKVAEHFFKGDSITFRTLITSAINLVTQANNLSARVSKTWYSHWPTDVELLGSDHQNAKIKTPRDAFEKINTTFIVKNDQRILETTYDQYLQGSFSPLEEEAFRNPQFKKLQILMTNLLDQDQYRQITQSNPIEADLTYWLNSWEDTRTKNLEKTIAAINALDKKGRIKFRGVKLNDPESVFEQFTRSQGTMGSYGQAADYPGAGSFLHSTMIGKGVTLLAALGLFGNDPVDSKAFPEFQKVGRSLKNNIGKGNGLELQFKVPFENWQNLTNEQAQDLNQWLDFKSENKTINYATELARFFLSYQNQITNAQWINLIHEITMLWNTIFEPHNLVGNLKTGTPTLVQPGYIVPKTTSNTSYYNDVRFIIRDT